jgi:hypothetical protein
MAPPPARPRLLHAALTGLALACFLGGLYLLGAAAWGLFHPLACADLAPRECALQQEALRELARYQAAGGGAFSLLGLALGALLRARRHDG